MENCDKWWHDISVEGKEYIPDAAVSALQRCREEDNFQKLSAISFDFSLVSNRYFLSSFAETFRIQRSFCRTFAVSKESTCSPAFTKKERG